MWQPLLTFCPSGALTLWCQAAAAAKTAMDAYLQELALMPELMRKRFALQKATWEVRLYTEMERVAMADCGTNAIRI